MFKILHHCQEIGMPCILMLGVQEDRASFMTHGDPADVVTLLIAYLDGLGPVFRHKFLETMVRHIREGKDKQVIVNEVIE
jgi:hypothetical protein